MFQNVRKNRLNFNGKIHPFYANPKFGNTFSDLVRIIGKSSWILTNYTRLERGRLNLLKYVIFLRIYDDFPNEKLLTSDRKNSRCIKSK